MERAGKVPAVPVLSQAEVDGLLYMREEKKLAHDVYITFYKPWGTAIFSNISKSEQRHADKVLALLNTYCIDDPVQEFGLFSNPDLQALYDSLVAQGSSSELDALYCGRADRNANRRIWFFHRRRSIPF